MTADSGAPELPRVIPVLPRPDAAPPLPIQENTGLQQITRIRRNLGIPETVNWELEQLERQKRTQAVREKIQEWSDQHSPPPVDVEEYYRELMGKKIGLQTLGIEGMKRHAVALYRMARAGVPHTEKTLELLERIFDEDLHDPDSREIFFGYMNDQDFLETLARTQNVPELVRRVSMLGYNISTIYDLKGFMAGGEQERLSVELMKADSDILKNNCRFLRTNAEGIMNQLISPLHYDSPGNLTLLVGELSQPLSKEVSDAITLLRRGSAYAEEVGSSFIQMDEDFSSISSFAELTAKRQDFERRMEFMATIVEKLGVHDADPGKVKAASAQDSPMIYGTCFLNDQQRQNALSLIDQGMFFDNYDAFTSSGNLQTAQKFKEKMADSEARQKIGLIADIYAVEGKQFPWDESVLKTIETPLFFDALDSIAKMKAQFSGDRVSVAELFDFSTANLINVAGVSKVVEQLPVEAQDFKIFWSKAQSKGYLAGGSSLPLSLFGHYESIRGHMAGGRIDEEVWKKLVPGIARDIAGKDVFDKGNDAQYLDLAFDPEIGVAGFQDLGIAYQHGLEALKDYRVLKTALGRSLLARADKMDRFYKDGKPTAEFLFSYLGKDENHLSRMLGWHATRELERSLPPLEASLHSSYEAFGSKERESIASYMSFFLGEGPEAAGKRELFIKAGTLLKSLPFQVASEMSKGIWDEMLTVLKSETADPEAVQSAAKALHIIELAGGTRSAEVKRMMAALKPLLMETEDVDGAFSQIEQMLSHNNLPQPMKNYLVMEMLFSRKENGQSRIDEIFTKDQGDVLLSPALKERGDEDRFKLLYRRAMRNAVQSNDPSLRTYLESFQDSFQVLDYVQRFGIEQTTHFHNRLATFLDKAEAMNSRFLNASMPRNGLPVQEAERLKVRLDRLAQSMGTTSYVDITRKLSTALLQPLGYESVQQALADMDRYRSEADIRNRDFARTVAAGGTIFAESDLLKSTQSGIMGEILKKGPQCAELLGADSSSNNTPFDADFSRVGATDVGLPFEEVLNRSITRTSMTEGNDVLLLVKNRGNFADTTSETNGYRTDDERYETFWSRYGDVKYGTPRDVEHRHHGVTVGVAATDVSAIILSDAFMSGNEREMRLNKLKFDIVTSGSYMPVIFQGKLVFTPEEYDSVRLSAQDISTSMTEANQEGRSSTAVLDGLMRNPLMARMYNQPAHVQEGYTVGEHTRLVLGQFDKYVKDYLVLMNMNPGEFSLMLSLHDIGKSFTEDTHEQHRFTRPIIEDIVRGLDMPQIRKDLIVEIASQDVLGELVKGDINQEQAQREIRFIAEKTGLTPLEIFQMCRYYYTCDVSSYTKDADPNSIGRFDGNIKFRGKDQNIILDPEWTAKLDGLKEEFLKQWLEERGET